MVLMPLLLVVLMIYRPHGIMGLRELRLFIPGYDRLFLNAKSDEKGKQDAA
jgi:branched-chain amino acid transport system permease protein